MAKGGDSFMAGTSAKRYRRIHRVRFADCDPARIVFYPRFFEMFDQGTEALFLSVGFDWSVEFGANGLRGLPIVDASSRFISPAKFGDELTIESWIGEVGGKSFVACHEIKCGDRLVAEGREVRVWAMEAPDRPQGIRAAPMPDDIRARLGV